MGELHQIQIHAFPHGGMEQEVVKYARCKMVFVIDVANRLDRLAPRV